MLALPKLKPEIKAKILSNQLENSHRASSEGSYITVIFSKRSDNWEPRKVTRSVPILNLSSPLVKIVENC